jgi:hypothetical protein
MSRNFVCLGDGIICNGTCGFTNMNEEELLGNRNSDCVIDIFECNYVDKYGNDVEIVLTMEW